MKSSPHSSPNSIRFRPSNFEVASYFVFANQYVSSTSNQAIHLLVRTTTFCKNSSVPKGGTPHGSKPFALLKMENRHG